MTARARDAFLGFKEIGVIESGPVLQLFLNRPQMRNALSAEMVREMSTVLAAVRDDRAVRVIVVRGTGGHFSAGGDIKSMQHLPALNGQAGDPIAADNRRFGALLEALETAPQATIAVVEGSAMGGGVGLVCAADIVIARAEAQFGVPEVMLGIVPAAISPFLVRRIGVAAARRLTILGARFDVKTAQALGLVHEIAGDTAELDKRVTETLNQLMRCAPGAVAETKRLMGRAASGAPTGELLDAAAQSFAAAVRGAEGQEGTRAFTEKRSPAWAPKRSS